MKLIKNLGTKKDPNDKQKKRYGLFYCKYCKKEIERKYHARLRQKSCGCVKCKLMKLAKLTHEDSQSNPRLYSIWINIKQRCNNSNNAAYKYYGGREIKVCNLWKESYIRFKIWALENGYKKELTIDRINNDGNYEPSNCK